MTTDFETLIDDINKNSGDTGDLLEHCIHVAKLIADQIRDDDKMLTKGDSCELSGIAMKITERKYSQNAFFMTILAIQMFGKPEGVEMVNIPVENAQCRKFWPRYPLLLSHISQATNGRN
ncbi:hypothetical protein O9G_003594 [Rozella allomycis CSF55]|uniref:Uncharacterized protein n=1 Tax=Rozella allomycis (strain CSF55) TaxID=988480 RepID=A0A075AT30_ROZAC|nr:hypothetical protein O9G_003594 [Rozella allomycis CSF55]|eukprot:EPZ31885.1 hypothetical protein O9G_003594 [Rozella allomycis CSF55]